MDDIMKRWFLKGEVCLSFIWFHLPMLSRIVRGGAYGGGWWVRGSWWWDDFSSLHFGLDGVHHLGVGDTEVNLDFTSFF